jgi:hypothetical protein
VVASVLLVGRGREHAHHLHSLSSPAQSASGEPTVSRVHRDMPARGMSILLRYCLSTGAKACSLLAWRLVRLAPRLLRGR